MSAYQDLLNKYNTLVAKCQSLQETLKSKDAQWEEKSKEFKAIDDNIRNLCKLILAKDKDQINIGTESGSWFTLSTRALIEQSIISYKKYNTSRSLIMKQVLELAEDRAQEIEGLKDQLAFYENNAGASKEEYEEASKKAKEEEELTETVDKADYETKENIKKNNIQVSIADDDSDINDLVTSAVDELDAIQPTDFSVPIKDTNGKIAVAREKKRQQQITKKYAAEIDLGRLVNDMSDLQKDYMTIIGKQGLSENPEIIAEICKMDAYKNLKKNTMKNQIYVAVQELQRMGIITVEKVMIPLIGRTNTQIIRFTDLGNRVYYLMMNERAKLCEANNLQMEHDNIHHGYGIKAIYQELLNSGLYKRVNMNCRKDPLIVDPKKNKNVTYIPDIIAICNKDDQKCFFEYERGFSTRDTIIEKCNKMVHFTRTLYFITNNSESAESLSKDIAAWKAIAIKKNLKVKVYLSSARNFQSQNFDVNGKWTYTFLEDSIDPVVESKVDIAEDIKEDIPATDNKKDAKPAQKANTKSTQTSSETDYFEEVLDEIPEEIQNINSQKSNKRNKPVKKT